jgi:dihydrofolate reductase
MPKITMSFSVSIDGFAAGLQQSREKPMGVGAEALSEWAFATRTFRRMHHKDWAHRGGDEGGTTGIDDSYFARRFLNVGAWILGRNMFGPIRGPWPDNAWRGWWGEAPPFGSPVFVLTHYPREPIPMQAGTTFHFVTDGIHRALEVAKAAAGGKDVGIGGGLATVQQYLRARLIDEVNLAICPTLIGAGEPFFACTDLVRLGYGCTDFVAGERATHVVLRRHAATHA